MPVAYPPSSPRCPPQHPIINAAYDPSGAIKYNADINIAMAVALDGGLITPTLKNADKIDIYSLGRKWKVGQLVWLLDKPSGGV